MATTLTLRAVCAQCSGTGTFIPGYSSGGGSPMECPWPGCNGTGYIEFGQIVLDPGLDDVMDRLQDVLDKCNDILEEVQG